MEGPKETPGMESESEDEPEDIVMLRKDNERQAQDITALRQVAQMLGEQLIVARMKSEGGTVAGKEPGRVLVLEKRVKQLQNGLRAAIKQRDHFQRVAASHSRLSTVPEGGSPPPPTKEETDGDQVRDVPLPAMTVLDAQPYPTAKNRAVSSAAAVGAPTYVYQVNALMMRFHLAVTQLAGLPMCQ